MARKRTGILAAGAGLATLIFAPSADAALVGQWTFNESTGNASDGAAAPVTGTLSSTGSALPGRGNDGTRRYVHMEQALQQFVSMGDPAKLRLSGPLSVEAWMRIPSGALGTFTQEPGVGKTFRYGFTAYSGNPIYAYSGSGAQSTTATYGQFTAVNAADDWHHVVMTYDNAGAGTLNLYIDGLLASTNAAAGAVPDTTGIPFYVGRSYDNGVAPNSFFTGDIDEVRVYDEALSGAAVTANYNGGAGPNPLAAPGNIRGLWSLDTLDFFDSSGRNNHLSNSGAVTVVPGMVGNAASFNGSSKLTVYSDDFDGPLTSFSNGAWIKVQGSSSDAGVIGDGGADFPYDITVHNGATAYAYLDDGGNNVNVGVPSDTWTHIAHTFDGTTHRLYLNGVEVATDGTGNTSTGPVTLPFQLGFVSTGFTGLIDEAFFTTNALTEEQIAQYMQGVPEPGSTMVLIVGGIAMFRRSRR